MKAKKLVVMRKRKYTREIALLAVLAVLIAVIAGLRLYNISGTPDDIAAVVNGKNITDGQVDKLHNVLMKRFGNISREEALSQAIDEALLLEEADKLEIVFSDDDVSRIFDDYKAATNGTDSDIELYFAARGISIEDAPEFVKKEQRINKLLNETILSGIEISDEEIEAYRDAFKQQIGKVGDSNIVFEPSDEEIRQTIYLDRAKNSLALYLQNLRSDAEIEVKP